MFSCNIYYYYCFKHKNFSHFKTQLIIPHIIKSVQSTTQHPTCN